MTRLDTAGQARRLAQTFAAMSQAIDNYCHTHFQQLTDAQRDSLSEEAMRLDDYSDEFTAEAIAKTLSSLKDDVDSLITATDQAAAALAKIQKIEKIAGIAAAALALGESIATGDVSSIGSSVKDLISAVGGSSTPSQAKKLSAG